MTDIKDNLFFVCTLIESIARKTKNHRKTVVEKLGTEGLKHHLKYADVNHSLPLEQVTMEVIEAYQISAGNFDTITHCKYKLPSVTSIGRLYQRLIFNVHQEHEAWEDVIKKVFSSFISDEISNFNSSIFPSIYIDILKPWSTSRAYNMIPYLIAANSI